MRLKLHAGLFSSGKEKVNAGGIIVDVFDIIGPVMVGPSSSHTAGAVGIGRVARALLAEEPVYALIIFHGSFAKTYRGHGTDRAIVSGILGMSMDDPNIPRSFDIARDRNMKVEFQCTDLGDVHPNTALVRLRGKSDKEIEVLASSIGGGRISVHRIDGMEVHFSGRGNTLIVFHKDVPGTIAAVTNILALYNINIGEMKVFRTRRGGRAVMVIDIDEQLAENILTTMNKLDNVLEVNMIPPV